MHEVRESTSEGFATWTLASGGGELAAELAPGAGMVGCSLRHRGEELLERRDGLRAYAEKGKTMGIPLLHPWANRLGGVRYEVGGRAVELDPEAMPIKLDPNGLPIHGALPGAIPWERVEHHADEAAARLRARADWAARPGPDEPFRARFEIAVRAG